MLKFFKMYGMINKTYVCWSIKCWKKIQRSEFTSSYVTQEIQQIEAKNKNNKEEIPYRLIVIRHWERTSAPIWLDYYYSNFGAFCWSVPKKKIPAKFYPNPSRGINVQLSKYSFCERVVIWMASHWKKNYIRSITSRYRAAWIFRWPVMGA